MRTLVLASALFVLPASILLPAAAEAQQPNTPAQVQQAEQDVEEAVRRFRIGVFGGVGIDPELIDFGAHATFAPIFTPAVEFRPGIEFGLGELTTMFGINLDVLYLFPGGAAQPGWRPYIGAGPNFALSHKSFETEDLEHLDIDPPIVIDDRNRFDFGDTDFTGGFNFVAGARSQGGAFFELKATAWGVSTVRLLGGFNF